MKKYLILAIISCVLSNHNVLSQESIEDSNFTSLGRRWAGADRGVIIAARVDNTTTEIDDSGVIVEIMFESNHGKKIFYEGANYRGLGAFYSKRNGERIAILETHIRYGPAIIWHGENVAEIIIPTGSPFTHSYFYNFSENKLSKGYGFPMYYDIENSYVLIWGNDDFELHDIKTDELLKVYNARRQYGLTHFYPTIMYYIEKMGTRIMLYFNDVLINDENTGIIIMEIITSHTSHKKR